MIRILGNISGILCAIILFVNFLSYFFKDIYITINSLDLKKAINLILPITSKYNKISIFIFFISFLIHISCFFINVNFFSFDILGLLLLSTVITFNFNIIPKSSYDYLRKISSYIIIFFIAFHIIYH